MPGPAPLPRLTARSGCPPAVAESPTVRPGDRDSGCGREPPPLCRGANNEEPSSPVVEAGDHPAATKLGRDRARRGSASTPISIAPMVQGRLPVRRGHVSMSIQAELQHSRLAAGRSRQMRLAVLELPSCSRRALASSPGPLRRTAHEQRRVRPPARRSPAGWWRSGPATAAAPTRTAPTPRRGSPRRLTVRSGCRHRGCSAGPRSPPRGSPGFSGRAGWRTAAAPDAQHAVGARLVEAGDPAHRRAARQLGFVAAGGSGLHVKCLRPHR